MFITIECYDMDSKAKFKAIVQVENIISIEPECFVDCYRTTFDDTCSIIYLKSDCILHSYLSPRDIFHIIDVESLAQKELDMKTFFLMGQEVGAIK